MSQAVREALKHHGHPETITTDELRSYGAALNDLGCRGKENDVLPVFSSKLSESFPAL